MPNHQIVGFYPERGFAYNGEIFIEVAYAGETIGRLRFTTRPLPTFVTGAVLDLFRQKKRTPNSWLLMSQPAGSVKEYKAWEAGELRMGKGSDAETQFIKDILSGREFEWVVKGTDSNGGSLADGVRDRMLEILGEGKDGRMHV